MPISGESRVTNDLSLTPGTDVQVLIQFDQSWASGFEIADAQLDGGFAASAYRIRRVSDNRVIPGVFSPTQLRRSP